MIEGRVEGKVDLKQQSGTVGQSGRVKADIFGRTITVEGEVKGNLVADEQITVRRTGQVQGNLTAPRVSLEDGASVLAELPEEPRLSVLDLGPAVGANLEFLSARYRFRLQVADLWRSARTHRLVYPEADPAALFRELLPLYPTPAIDLVLAWDLLNYLRRDQIRALAEHLAPAYRPGGRLFAMALIGREIPRQPLTYELREEGATSSTAAPAARSARGPDTGRPRSTAWPRGSRSTGAICFGMGFRSTYWFG